MHADQRRPAAGRTGRARCWRAEYTRIPLWRDKPENIIGVLHAKDLLRAIQASDGDTSQIDVTAIALPPWFVPEMRPLSEQLKAFRRRKTHFALVVDEYGEVEGLVTLEDILEEIVGDISDEHDVVVAGRPRRSPTARSMVDGSVPIRDLNRAMDWHLPDEEATTVAGLVIHEARSIPEPRPELSPSTASASRCCGASATASRRSRSRRCRAKPRARIRSRSGRGRRFEPRLSSMLRDLADLHRKLADHLMPDSRWLPRATVRVDAPMYPASALHRSRLHIRCAVPRPWPT